MDRRADFPIAKEATFSGKKSDGKIQITGNIEMSK
jgi:hypothetical protein